MEAELAPLFGPGLSPSVDAPFHQPSLGGLSPEEIMPRTLRRLAENDHAQYPWNRTPKDSTPQDLDLKKPNQCALGDINEGRILDEGELYLFTTEESFQ
jgi:hypothetical protein